MKKSLYLCVLLFVSLLCACGQAPVGQSSSDGTATWQEQYDLGVRYLSEGNYEEAIIAFTAAIEIDPKQAPAYVGRGDAYIGLGGTEENLSLAQADYEKAIELDETIAGAYLGLADVYICQGDYDKALESLRQGLEKLQENETIQNKIEEIESLISMAEPWGIRNYDDFNTEQQQFIEDLVNAMEQGEFENAWAILKNIEVMAEEHGISFVFQKYRVRMFDRGSNHSDSIGGTIEIHPLNGQGFYCHYTESEDGHFDEAYLVGACEGWNWNGEFEKYWRYYYPDDSDTVTLWSGTMCNGLLNGSVKDTTKRTYLGENAEIFSDWENTYEELYDMGIRIRSEDSTQVYSATSGFLVGNEKSWNWALPQ